MINLTNKENCSGCHACSNICPVGCITMMTDREGFVYPEVDKKKCINCNKCTNVCNIINPIVSNNIPKAYACYNKNEDIRLNSSSGGIFTLIAEYILDLKGVVFGAAFDKDFTVKHIEVTEKEQLNLLRGSKYVQSKIGDTYKFVKKYLDGGRAVLFTGTPCQIDGLIKFLGGKEYDKLYTQDIICHGVPSPKVWRDYVSHIKQGLDCDVDNITFRNKDNGWINYSIRFNSQSGVIYNSVFRNDYFMTGFIKNLYLRPSCYNCHSKSINRNSDITLADFWGIDNIVPEMNDDKGTSLIFVNTDKGTKLFNNISEKIVYQKVDYREAVKYNSSAYVSVHKPKHRDKVIKKINCRNFDKIIERYTTTSFLGKCRIKLNIIFKSIIKK